VKGERRAGKTSFIRHLCTALPEITEEYVCVEIPWNGNNDARWLAREILQAVRLRRYLISGAADTLADFKILHLPETPETFVEALRETLAGIAPRRLILAIDEYDSILHESPEEDEIVSFMTALATSSLDIQLLLTVARVPDILVGTPLAPPASRLVTLCPFGRTDLDKMILQIVGEGHPLSPAELEAIYRLSGGWPYYAKLILNGLADQEPGEGQLWHAVNAAAQEESAALRITNVYDIHLDDDEKALLLLLAAGNGSLTAEETVALGANLQESIWRLVERSYVEAVPAGGCSLRIRMLTAWLRHWPRFPLEVERRLSQLPYRLEVYNDSVAVNWIGALHR
jgi:hypothetical protein